MLIVMMIIVTLMGMGIGAWINTAERSQSLATQQIVYSLIQQARNRSLSSGEAVVIRLIKDDGRIIGMHKNYLFHVKNAWNSSNSSARPADKPNLALPLFIEEEDGFSIRCQVNAPPAGNASTNIIPLLHITEADHAEGNWVHSSSGSPRIAGLELWRVPQFINHDNLAVPVAETWAIVGWIGKRPNYPSNDRSKIGSWNSFIKADNYVREWSYDDDDDDTSNALNDLEDTRYSLKPYTGDQWIDIDFTYDNNNLYLKRNGQQTDFFEMERKDNPLNPDVNQKIDIYIGSHERGSSQTEYLSVADIDNVSILQIGSGDEELLPGSITPQNDYKIVCVDGVISCYEIDEDDVDRPFVQIDTLKFIDRDAGSINFDLSIGQDGNLLASKIYTAAEISEYDEDAEEAEE